MKNKLLKQTGMIISLAVNDFKAVYAGSALGSLWAVAEPLVTMAIYWFVYTIALGGSDIDGIKYYIWLAAGLSPWLFISNGLNRITSVYRDYSYLVKKMRFDKSILPYIRCISAFFTHLIFLSIVIILCLTEGTNINILALMLSIILNIFFVYSLGRILALLCGMFKDIQHIIGVALNIGFWLTPIFWHTKGLNADTIRLLYLNPAAIITYSYRAALLYGEFSDTSVLIYLAAICLIMSVTGRLVSRKASPTIADRL